MTDPVLASRPGPDVDHGPIRYEGHAVATKNQIPAVRRVRLSHARQMPHGYLDRVVGDARAVDQRRLLCAFAQKYQNVVVGIDPSQTAMPQSMAGVSCRDEAAVDLEYPRLCMIFLLGKPWAALRSAPNDRNLASSCKNPLGFCKNLQATFA